jgi:hypothetical protein
LEGVSAQICAISGLTVFVELVMPNHAARAYVIGVRKIMRALGFNDESPKNIIFLRNKHNIVRPSDGSIQSMFGRRMALAKVEVCRGIIKVINTEAQLRGTTGLSDRNIIQFNCLIEDIGHIVSYLESHHSSATDIRGDLAIDAGYPRVVIDACISQRLLPRVVCENIERALQKYGIKTHGIRELASADTGREVPAREGGRSYIIFKLGESE